MSTSLLLSGCGGDNADQLLAKAKEALARKDAPTASIQLKSTLQKDPQRAEARFLLGRLLLEGGDAAAASVELRKAYDLKYDENQVLPLLARSLLAEGEARRVTDAYAETRLADKAAQADLMTSVAAAWLRQSKLPEAEKKLAEALAAQPGFAPALLARADLAARKDDLPAALALLDEVVAQDPKHALAWLMRGELLLRGAAPDKAAALESFRKAAAAQPALLPAHQGLVTLLLQAGDVEGAAAHVAEVKKQRPKDQGVALLEAEIAYVRKDYEATRTLTAPLLQAAPNNAMLLQMAGAAEYHLQNWPQAENLLAQAVKAAPGLPLATQMLARIQLRNGQPDKALETLRPNLEARPPLPEALSLAGEAFLAAGDAEHADQMFALAVKDRPDLTRARTALAMSKIGKGEAAAGFADLEALSASDSGITADLALLAGQLRRGDTAAALKAVDAIERKQPGSPVAPNLRGRVQMLKKDAPGARKSFELAIARDPSYFPALASLAALDMAENQPDAAKKRFQDRLAADPRDYRAMMALAALLAREGGQAPQVGKLLADAIKAAPASPEPRVRLAGHQLAQGDKQAALATAQDAAAALPTNSDVVMMLARTQLAAGEYQQAVTTFNKLAGMQPKSALPLVGLAEAQLGLKDRKAAEASFRHALELEPEHAGAQRALLALLTEDGRYDDATALARGVQQRKPDSAWGWQLEGSVELQRRRWDNAIAAYRTVLQKAPNADSAMRLHGAFAAAGRADEDARFADGWLKDHPKDAVFAFYLGDVAMGRSDWPQAEARYRQVLEMQPANALALNNVAWLLVKQGKPGALPLAQKANEVLPGKPPLLDTLALALAADNQLPQALALQRKNVDSTPQDGSLRLTLAKLYLKAGDKAKAKSELETLSKLGRGFTDHAEVEALLKQV